MSQTALGEFIPLIFMAFATSMDAFSVSLGIGMQKIRLKRIALIGMIFGVFHVIMPFSGILLGNIISNKVGHLTTLLGGSLLIAIGVHMLLSAFNDDSKEAIKVSSIGMFALAFIVSVDSFSVGLGIGLSGTNILITLLLFGFISMLLTWIGLLFGRKVYGFLGAYSEILGGSILCGFGLHILFG
ncbi:MAG TPA: manganese efflux pump [Pseudogracilibacillus sp.]|nr:manganese efflux pump [Pseudogracilibacillus sp.]